MKRIIAIFIFIYLVFPVIGNAAGYKELWKRAADHYHAKQYDSAVLYFEQVAASKPQNAEVYFNLGNAYYRMNKVALAVLNYQRALFIDPDYKEARENLEITQARIPNHTTQVEDIFFIGWWKQLTAHTMATDWAVASLITFLLIIFSVWARRFMAIGARIPVQLPGILTFVFCCFLIFGFVAAANSRQSPDAVVMENDTPMMNEQLKGKPLALLPEGATVKVVSQRGTWVEVSLPDSRTGWIMQSQMIRI